MTPILHSVLLKVTRWLFVLNHNTMEKLESQILMGCLSHTTRKCIPWKKQGSKSSPDGSQIMWTRLPINECPSLFADAHVLFSVSISYHGSQVLNNITSISIWEQQKMVIRWCWFIESGYCPSLRFSIIPRSNVGSSGTKPANHVTQLFQGKCSCGPTKKNKNYGVVYTYVYNIFINVYIYIRIYIYVYLNHIL